MATARPPGAGDRGPGACAAHAGHRPMKPLLSRPPGERLRRFFAGRCSPRVLERVVDPIVADMQYEWQQAMARGDRRAALFVRLRGYAGFGRAVLLQSMTGEWRPPAVTLGGPPRIAAGVVIAFVGLSAVLMTWSFGGFWSHLRALPAMGVRPGTLTFSVFSRLLLEFLPSATVLTIPPSVLLGTLLAVRDRATSSRRPRALALRLLPAAAAATAATLVLTTTVMPRTNQAFRQAAFTLITGSSRPVAPGDRELTLGELDVAIPKLESAGDSRAAGYRVERQKRFAMPAACGAFGLVARGMAAQRRPGCDRRWVVGGWPRPRDGAAIGYGGSASDLTVGRDTHAASTALDLRPMIDRARRAAPWESDPVIEAYKK